MSRPKALDLFCGAGGAAMGLWRAGFDVVGVDIVRQKRYPFSFIQGDALKPPVRLEDFDLVWASPPCQYASVATPIKKRGNHPNLIGTTRAMLQQHARLWVIENVPGARHDLSINVLLCGTMFGLPFYKHRLFETRGFCAAFTPPCRHSERPRYVVSSSSRDAPELRSREMLFHLAGLGHCKTRHEARNAIPPAYSEHIGYYAMLALGRDTDAMKRR